MGRFETGSTGVGRTLRADSLDALRGYAIVTMVLASAILSYALPGWMSHVQTPPPDHAYHPEIPGISWVDLVFPFFLFALGAALPFSLGSKLSRGESGLKLVALSALRALKLAFFAIVLQHVYSPVRASADNPASWLIPISAFVALFLTFCRFPGNIPKTLRAGIHVVGYLSSILIVLLACRFYPRDFSLSRSNIIILVMANMAFFASLAYIATYRMKPALRLLLVPLVMFILLAEGSWQQWLLNATPAPWLYRFAYLKYLCTVIPGTVAGDYLRDSLNCNWRHYASHDKSAIMLIMCLGLVILNLWGLYTRNLELNLILTLMMLVVCIGLSSENEFWRRLVLLGSMLLAFGLFAESFQGGIKKDPATLSYFLTTSGLACFALLAFDILCGVFNCNRSMSVLVMPGKNPMLAYVTTSLLVNPLLQLTSLWDLLGMMDYHPVAAFMRGVIVTSITVAVTILFTKLKCLWRT